MIQDTSTPLLKIGDLARRTGKTVRALHLYEELGLLSPASRTLGGFRLYEPRAAERVRWIDHLHGMGFSLQEMRQVLEGWWGAELGPQAMEGLRRLYASKLEETREAVTRYQQLERELERGLAYLETCRECATPSISVEGCVRCGQDHGMREEPVLLAGITSSPGRTRRPKAEAFIRVEEIR